MKALADRPWVWLLAAVAALALTADLASAQEPAFRQVSTNEAYLEDVTRTTTLAITDPVAVFAFVLDNLPDRVNVYPTGNYYYFRFTDRGIPFAGNIRLDVLDRDSGKVHFAYYVDASEWEDGEAESDLKVGGILDGSNGVTVVRLEPLVYRVSQGRKSVVFALNDLSNVKPPANALAPDERFVGPIFDESGMTFFLVYNPKLRSFLYILDETGNVADDVSPSELTDRIVIGRRTGFAFYLDQRLDRKVLIGVFEGNRQANNYLDGPFDQLPENFIEGETLRDMLVEAAPGLEGQIDRLGNTSDFAGHYAIVPYRHYRTESDLYPIHECATNDGGATSSYYQCFVVDHGRGTDTLDLTR